MATLGNGPSAFDRLKTHYDQDTVCPACGHEDEGGHWRAETSGSRVHYEHTCPSCGAVESRDVSIE